MRQEDSLEQYERRESNIGRFDSYTEYEETGIQYLERIPADWNIVQLKRACKYIKTGSTPSTSKDEYYENEEVPWYGPESISEDLIVGNPSKWISKTALEKGAAPRFEDDSVLITIIGNVGKVAYLDKEGSANQQIRQLKFDPEILDNKYATYQLKAFEPIFDSLAPVTTLPILGKKAIDYFEMAVPPKEQQEVITEFLDSETERIDNLIRKKKELIKLLEEKQAAVINKFVTSGIDDQNKKNIGVDWFDSIPEGWETTSLRNTVDKFVDYRGATPEKSDSGITLITAKNIDDGNLDFSEDHEYVTEEVYEDWMTRGYPEEGDVLITTEAPMGEVAQVQETPVALAQRIILLKINTDLIKKDFLKYFLGSEFNQTQLIKSQTGSTAKGIQASKLKGIRVLIPPLSEQEKIIEKIEQESKKIDELISEVEEGLERLKEYRTALITETVTGQIDVRGEV